MRRGITTLIFGSTALAMLALQPNEADAAEVSAKAEVYATIATPLEIASATHLTFGTFAEPSEPGSAELSPDEGLVRCNLATLDRNGSKPALITVNADPGQTFGLALSDVARVGNGPMQLEVSSFTHNAGATPVVDFRGARQLKVGATLFVTHDAPSGAYRGNFDVIVTNN